MSANLVEGALNKHLAVVEIYGNAARGFQAWLTAQDSNRDLILIEEKKKLDEAWLAVCESVNELIEVVQRNQS